MANAEIPHLSWAIRHSLDRLAWQHSIYNEEFIERLLLCMGHPSYFTKTRYGIVSETDPGTHIAGGDYPLAVSANSENTLSVDVAPGMAVTKTGVWVKLSDYVRNVTLADSTVGVPNVVYVEYTLQPSNEQLNDYLEPVIPLFARSGANVNLTGISGLFSDESLQVNVDTVDTFLGYFQSVTANVVPLAVVTVQSSLDAASNPIISLSIDHTQNTYSWNRPWFSIIDVEHRNMVGSGTVSNSNPHGIGENEITSGNFTRAQISNGFGMILSKDLDVAKVPGVKCEGSINTDQLLTDDSTGTVTGFPNTKYFKLSSFPTSLGKVWVESNGEEFAATLVPEKNIIVFPSDPPPSGENLLYVYTQVKALEPPTTENLLSIEVTQPTSNDLVIAGGLGHTSIGNTTVPFSDAQQFPMWFELFVDKNGDLIKTPQVVYCYKKLEDIGVQDTPTISQYGNGKLMVGLKDASGSVGMSVKIKVYGKDADGNSIDETFSFTDSSWSNFTVPTTSFPDNAFVVGTSVFSSIETIAVEERIGDGPNSAIVIYCLNTPIETETVRDACYVASVFWDGLRVTDVNDKRIVETTDAAWLRASMEHDALNFLLNMIAGYHSTIWIEDMRRPRLGILTGETTSNSVLSQLPKYKFSKLTVGDGGEYVTRALPVYSGSGDVWHVTMFPHKLLSTSSGNTPLKPEPPKFRYKSSSGVWSSWNIMTPVSGVNNTFSYQITPSDVPKAVQVSAGPWFLTSGIVIFG